MKLTDQHVHEFVEQGYSLIDDVFTADEITALADGMDEYYAGVGARTDGIVGYPDHRGINDVYQHPHLEKIAAKMLGVDEIVLVSAATLYKRHSNTTEWTREGEHVDVMFSVDELRQAPRRMLCMMMVFANDLPEGRGNTWVRPGSHMQIAQWLTDNNQKPVRESPTVFDNLPKLDYAEPIPVVAKAGQVMCFSTALIHCGSTNITSEPRKLMFSNYCQRGRMSDTTGNYNQREARTNWREGLKAKFRPDRQHLLLDSEA